MKAFWGVVLGLLMCNPAYGFMLIAGRSGGADVVVPHMSGATIDGDALVLQYDENVTQGAGYNDADIDVDCSTTGADLAVTYASGDGTSSHTYTVASPAVFGETCDLDFNGDADSLEDGAGNDLAAITSGTITNNTSSGDCDNLGAWALYYDVDHTSGTTTACVSGGTATTTLTSVTASDTVNTTSGGTYGVLWDGVADHFVSIPIASSGVTSQDGRVELNMRTTGTLAENTVGIFEYGNDSVNGMINARLQYSATGFGGGPGYRLIFTHYDGSNVAAVTAYVSAAINTTYAIILDWNSTAGKVFASLSGSSNLSAAGTLSSFTPGTSPTDPKFGERFSSNVSPQAIGFDDIYMGDSQQ